MGKKKDANTAIGRSIIKSRQRKSRSGQSNSWHHTSDLDDGYDWNRINLNSVTEQNSLDEFLTTAELAGTEFTAEKLNITVINDTYSGLPTIEEEEAIHKAQEDNKELLGIPRRPQWDTDTTASELEMKERESFMSWRRQLASLEEKDHVVLTPFERNLEFWRQLWRVIERSDVVVQIVDARNPLLFRCEDLEKYVKEVSEEKENFILLSKADLLTQEQRDAWAEYFTQQGIRVAFWSAFAETERIKQELDSEEQDGDNEADDEGPASETQVEAKKHTEEDDATRLPVSNPFSQLEEEVEGLQLDEESSETPAEEIGAREGTSDGADGKSAMNIHESDLEDHERTTSESPHLRDDDDDDIKEFVKSTKRESDGDISPEGIKDDDETDTSHPPDVSGPGGTSSIKRLAESNNGNLVNGDELLELIRSVHKGKKVEEGITTVGMVGYPNVGKSSTINALLQQKKVPVSATPGRTKHFQTLFVEPTLCLCDCPGLVMPSFVSSKGEMVIYGILPVDQLRDFVSPVSLICQMVPRRILNKFYKISIIKPKEGEDPNRPPTALEFLNAYAYNRGYMTQKGVPNARRVSLLVLKDFVNGRLLYRKPPPGISDEEFDAVCEPVVKEGYEESRPNRPTITEEGTQQKHMTSESLDATFFEEGKTAAHSKGTVGSQGLKKVGGYVVYTDNDGVRTTREKTWRKHGNRNKKEKLRRTYKHLDVK